MPYRQVFELQDTSQIHGSQLIDQSVNLGIKGIPGSLTADLFPTNLEAQNTSLRIARLYLLSGPSGGNEQIVFKDVNYSIWQDNTGSGSANSRLWFDGPDGGEFIFGPRSGSVWLDQVRVRANTFRVEGSGGIRLELQSGGDSIFYDPNGNEWLQHDDSLDRISATASSFRLRDGSTNRFWVFSGGNITFYNSAGSTRLTYNNSSDIFEFYRLLDFNNIPESSGSQVFGFNHGYRLYVDNTGGSHGSRMWFDAPDGGTMHVGGRGSSEYLDSIRWRARAFTFNWVDGGGDAASHNFPTGLVYDFGYHSTTGGVSFGTSMTSVIAAAVSVPANISVTVIAWAWANWDNSGSRVHNRSRLNIAGGTGLLNIQENDLTASGTTGSDAHTHGAGSYDAGHITDSQDHFVNGTSSSDSHSHSASLGLSPQWKHLNNVYARSFVPTGTSITVSFEMQTSAGSQTAANKELAWMVIIN